MIFFVDIDETICHNANAHSADIDYTQSVPRYDMIEKINALYREGHTIIYHTARGGKTGKNWFHFTYDQLRRWRCLFHELRMGKPEYAKWIDDKALRIEEL